MKNKFNSILSLIALIGVVSAACFNAEATITTTVAGGNDNLGIQFFSLTNTYVSAVAKVTNTGYLDISQFDKVTLFMVATNPFSNPSTNRLTIYRAIDNSGLTTESAAYGSWDVALPATSYTVWHTNFVIADICGQGFLTCTVSNTAPSGTNGSGGAGYNFTNTFPTQIGVSSKILHALR